MIEGFFHELLGFSKVEKNAGPHPCTFPVYYVFLLKNESVSNDEPSNNG